LSRRVASKPTADGDAVRHEAAGKYVAPESVTDATLVGGAFVVWHAATTLAAHATTAT